MEEKLKTVIDKETGQELRAQFHSTKAFDRTVTNYLYVSIELVNTADQARLEGIQLTIT